MMYAAWIAAFVDRYGGNTLGKCREAAQEMADAFPELRIARGHVLDAQWGKRGHWWLVAPNGSIVDPTAAQFPCVLDYEEWRPGDEVRVGRCMNCGDDIYVTVETLDSDEPPRRYACSRACEKELQESTI